MATMTQTETIDAGVSSQTKEPRYYTANLHANYLLPADAPERARLKLQHELLKKEYSDELIPSDFELHAGDHILDSGTGGGHWVEDVVALVPEGVTVHGCDVEGRMFPNEPPANTSFSVKSVLDLPRDWTSLFSLVHQRLLVAALGLPQWKQALSEIHRVLKPGGLVTLEEVGPLVRMPANRLDYESTLPNTWKMWTILNKIFIARNLMLDSPAKMPEMLKEAGFEMVKVESTVLMLGPGEETIEARTNFLGVYKGMKWPVVKLGGLGVVSGEEEYDKLMTDMEEEWKVNHVGLEFYGFTAKRVNA